jgi:hypothetical protein
MEDECTITILRSKEVVENQVEERKEEQIEIPQKPHREKEESTETSPTSTLIPEVQRSQESCLLGLCHEQIEDTISAECCTFKPFNLHLLIP